MATFPGTDGNDKLVGGAENDTLTGGAGADTLDGGAGNDVLAGGIGGSVADDWFDASLGNDTIYGGDIGVDDDPAFNFNDINYLNRGFSSIRVEFGSTSRSGTVQKSDGSVDTFFSIDAVRGTNGADTFIGGSGLGTQRFVGYGGNDIFDGTLGVNEVDYRADARAVGLKTGMTINLAGGVVLDPTGSTDTLIAIERVRGTENNDEIIGNALNNRLRGDAGNDTIDGGEGRDWLEGGAGDDVLIGGLGFGDYLEGGAGNDTIYGGQSTDGRSNTNDVAAFNLPTGTPGALSLVRTSATTGIVTLDGSVVFEITQLGNGTNAFEVKGVGLAAPLGTDIVRNIDEIQFAVPGGSFVKLQIGVSVYSAGAGNFFIEGGILDNRIDASLVFGATSASTINAEAGSGNDTVLGHNGRNNLSGEDGNDALYGRGGNDILNGNIGGDRLDGGLANDIMNGGIGKDKFIFSTKLGTSRTDRKVNFDAVKDFSVKDDSIWLDNAIFKKLGKKGTEQKPAKLDKDFFALNKAMDKDDYVIYNKKTGVLSYDADGSGKGQAIEFAQLKKGLALKYTDFFVM
jgi:Ca2+-binding RTX toxin-like protein